MTVLEPPTALLLKEVFGVAFLFFNAVHLLGVPRPGAS